jgi:hyperosmotically inducible periplasmic protein
LALGFSFLFAQSNASDDRIHDQVKLRLAGDPVVGGGAIDVDVKSGSVTLRGKVRSDKQKQRAGSLAKKVKGVKDVANNLTVEMP